MTQKNIERVSFFILLTLVSIAFVGLLRGFLVSLFWAVAFAILFAPLADRVRALVGKRDSLVAVGTVVVVMLAVVIPLLVLGFAVAAETGSLLADLRTNKDPFGRPVELVREYLPRAHEWADGMGLDWNGLKESLSSAAMVSGQWVAGNAVRAGQGTLNFTLSLFLMMYLLYFFLRDGSQIIDRLVQVLPLGDVRERALFARFAQVVRATVKGTFIIGAIQGTIGGITFALLGINGAVLWGVLMALFSLLPAVGAAIVWVPAAIMLFTNQEYMSGAILVAVGVLGIGLADNLLRPLLVGRDTRMPDYLILLATLGGLGTFGISGLIIGPLIAALFITVWEMFEASFGELSPTDVLFADEHDDVAAADAEAAGARTFATGGVIGSADVANRGVPIDEWSGGDATTIPNTSDDELPDPGLDDEFYPDPRDDGR